MRAPRLGAVAPLSATAQQAFFRRHGQSRGAPHWARDLERNWDESARSYAQWVGPASYNANTVAEMVSECDFYIEVRNTAGDWEETDDPRLKFALERYENKWQDYRELIGVHAYRYAVDAHPIIAWWDGDLGIEYAVFPKTRVKYNEPQKDFVKLELIEGGRIEDETALVVPVTQVFRCWKPNPDQMLQPHGAMQASIEDLHRYRALTKHAWRTAESRIAMEGVFFVPSEAARDLPPPDPDEIDLDNVGEPADSLEDDYYKLARLSLAESDDITAIAPPFVSWDKEAGEPKWVQVGKGLDPAGITERTDALNAAARAWALPNMTVEGGGSNAAANHWTQWDANEQAIRAIKPVLRRVCHRDLTHVWLYRALQYEGLSPAQVRSYRVGYSTDPISVKPDLSDVALRLAALGGLSYESLLKSCGFNPDDKLTDVDEAEQMMAFLSKGATGDAAPGAPPTADASGLPASPATTEKVPPAAPPTNGNGSAPPVAVASLLAALLDENTH